MTTKTPHPVVIAYTALGSVRAKLSYDPSGRPGAAVVRADQERLAGKRRQVQERTKRMLGHPAGHRLGSAKKPAWERPPEGREAYYAWQHAQRRAPIDIFLSNIAGWRADAEIGSPRWLLGLGRDTRAEALGSLYDVHPLGDGWWYRRVEHTEEDWEKYSKAWHRAYGPARTVTGRTVTFARMVGSSKERHVVNLSTWGGDWLARAVVEAGLAPKMPAVPMAIRLHAAYDAVLVDDRHGYQFYRRTLLGAPIDWVAIAPLGTTYHAATKKEALRGLHQKVRSAKLRLSGRLIDWAKCRALGFCESGILAFCETFGLNCRGAYTPEEVEAAVRAKADRATPYLAELRTLASAVGYNFPAA